MAFDLSQARNEMGYLTFVLVFGSDTLRIESFPEREYFFPRQPHRIYFHLMLRGLEMCGWMGGVAQAPMEYSVWPSVAPCKCNQTLSGFW
jgi:hypothetical protein